MTAFLMLFAEHRDLVLSGGQAKASLAAASERIAALEAENKRLRDEVARVGDARAEELRKVADTFSQQAIHRNVFARTEAPVVSGEPVAQPRPRKVFASDLARQGTRATIQSLYEEAVQSRQQTDPAA